MVLLGLLTSACGASPQAGRVASSATPSPSAATISTVGSTATPANTETIAIKVAPSVAATAFPVCASDDSKRYQTQVDDLLHEWDDADAIASRSNRSLIGTAIPGLQSVCRRAEKAELPACASAVHRWLLRWFDGRINSYLEFLGNNDTQAQQLLHSAQIAQAVFEEGYAHLSDGQAWDEQQSIQQVTLQFAPTATPTIAPATSTPVIPTSSVPTLEPVPTEGPVVYLTVSSANPVTVRNGPGTDYDSVGEITPGVSIQVSRKLKTDEYTWYQIQFTQSPNGFAWVREDVVTIIGNAGVVPTAESWVIEPYSATVRFLPRNNYGEVALGSLPSETHQATLQWTIEGAKRDLRGIFHPLGMKRTSLRNGHRLSHKLGRG